MFHRAHLAKIKREKGMTTEELSDRSGVPRGTINKLLSGETKNPTAQTLQNLADALDVPLKRAHRPAK